MIRREKVIEIAKREIKLINSLDIEKITQQQRDIVLRIAYNTQRYLQRDPPNQQPGVQHVLWEELQHIIWTKISGANIKALHHEI